MRNAREPIWWLPLLRRIVRWGAVTAIIVNALPLFIVACFAYAGAFRSTVVLSPDDSLWIDVVVCLFFASVVTLPFAVMGAVIGWTSGFYAPPSEPVSPFKSKFSRIVTTQTLGVWMVACVFIIAGFASSNIIFFNLPFYFDQLSPNQIYGAFGISFFVFALSLWLATNRALAATKLK